eukprot:7386573-Prymnesium_polylepis.1
MPNEHLAALLKTLAEHDNGLPRHVLAVLTETQLRGQLEITWAMRQLTALGYEHAEAHGAAGIRDERGGVVVAWRSASLHVWPFAEATPTQKARLTRT